MKIGMRLPLQMVRRAETVLRHYLFRWMPASLRTDLKNDAELGEVMAPFDDRYWADAFCETLMQLVIQERKPVMVHHEMLDYVENSVPYLYSFCMRSEDVSVLCLHKGVVDELSMAFVATLLETHCIVYANPVFCVYAPAGRMRGADARFAEHGFCVDLWLKRRRSNQRIRSKLQALNRGIKTIQLVTANQYGNVGDDAITHASVQMISQLFPEARIVVNRCPVARDDIEQSDLLVLGGGGLYYDGDIRNAINYASLMLYAKEAGVPYIGIGIGTQGIRSEIGRTLLRTAINGALLTVVRDQGDQQALRDIGVISRIEVTNDLVFSLAPLPLGRYQATSDRKRIGIVLVDSNHLRVSAAMTAYRNAIWEVVQFCSNQKYEICYLCQSLDDLSLYQDLQRAFGGQIRQIGFDDAARGFEFYRDLDLCITSRFHGLIFAAIAGVPLISVGSPGSKIDRLINSALPSLGRSHLSVKEFSFETLRPLLAMWESEPSRLSASRTEVLQCRDQAVETMSHVRTIVGLTEHFDNRSASLSVDLKG